MTTPVAVVIAAVIIAGTVAFIFRYAVATSNRLLKKSFCDLGK